MVPHCRHRHNGMTEPKSRHNNVPIRDINDRCTTPRYLLTSIISITAPTVCYDQNLLSRAKINSHHFCSSALRRAVVVKTVVSNPSIQTLINCTNSTRSKPVLTTTFKQTHQQEHPPCSPSRQLLLFSCSLLLSLP